jgi:hypothetical protein
VGGLIYTMFAETYLQTTDPQKRLSDFFQGSLFFMIVFSVIFHTIIYVGFFNLVSYVFQGKTLSSFVNTRLITVAAMIMSLGYIGRFYYVKDIFHAYKKDVKLTRKHCDKFFISWVFLA